MRRLITYCESRDGERYFWKNFFLKNAKVYEEWVAAIALSRQWCTGACADLPVDLNRSKDPIRAGIPVSKKLIAMEWEFRGYMLVRDAERAYKTYVIIQSYGMSLIKKRYNLNELSYATIKQPKIRKPLAAVS